MNSMLEKIDKIDRSKDRIDLVNLLVEKDINMLNVASVGMASVLTDIENHHGFDKKECMDAHYALQEFIFNHISDKLGGINIAVYALAQTLANLVDMYDRVNVLLDKMAIDGSLSEEDLFFLATTDSALVETEKACKAIMASKDKKIKEKSTMAAKKMFDDPIFDNMKNGREIKKDAAASLYKNGVIDEKEVARLIKENKTEVSEIYSKLDKEDFDKIMKELSNLGNSPVEEKEEKEELSNVISGIPFGGGIKISADDLPEGLREILDEAFKNNDAKVVPIKLGDSKEDIDVVSKILNDLFNK